ncbi:hypothetical protein CK203_086966 [Vitis vinifera]|uniref:Uncharacterized protein n=1 Tax=Vitis vinifera TaxID=29760 RepID=A0A438FIV2_VITVI|nr:hypothetical protein CK203_086966 [Vitis vinifera]
MTFRMVVKGGVTLVVANSLASQRDLIEGISVKGKGDLLREGLPNKDLEGVKVVSNESLNNQSFQKFVSFSEFLGLSMEGFEKEVESLLRKPEVRKGRKVVRDSYQAAGLGDGKERGFKLPTWHSLMILWCFVRLP